MSLAPWDHERIKFIAQRVGKRVEEVNADDALTVLEQQVDEGHNSTDSMMSYVRIARYLWGTQTHS